MGASSSINNDTKNNIYISYDSSEKSNHYLRVLKDELEKMNKNILHSEVTRQSLGHLTATEISFHIENILKYTSYFIICISEKTIRSFHQTIEINNALDSKKEVLYLIMDKSLNPVNSPYVKSIVKKEKWFMFYDDEHLLDCLSYLLDLKL